LAAHQQKCHAEYDAAHPYKLPEPEESPGSKLFHDLLAILMDCEVQMKALEAKVLDLRAARDALCRAEFGHDILGEG
jgi:hypothetical protein